MNRLIRFLLSGVVGVIFGRVIYPRFVGLTATVLGDVQESTGAADERGYALVAGLVVVIGIVFGILARLRAFRASGKPSRLPWVSRWAFVQLCIGGIVLGTCAYLSRTASVDAGWVGGAASFGAWLSVWAGAVVCAALALAAGLAIIGEQSTERRWPALIAPCAFVAVAQFATTDLASFDQVVEEARSEPGASIALVPARVPSRQDPINTCAKSFLEPNGSRRNAYLMNRRIVERRARWNVDQESLLNDAVWFTCRASPTTPESYFTVVVKNLLIHQARRSPPDGATCELDHQLPAQPLDLDFRIQTARCWDLLQAKACERGTQFVALLHLRASGATYPQIAEVLGGSPDGREKQLTRFVEKLPAEILEQCP